MLYVQLLNSDKNEFWNTETIKFKPLLTSEICTVNVIGIKITEKLALKKQVTSKKVLNQI